MVPFDELATDKTFAAPQFLTPEIELLGEKELLHNILPKFGACRLQLIIIRSEVFKFSRVC